jgi:hypothetical protein
MVGRAMRLTVVSHAFPPFADISAAASLRFRSIPEHDKSVLAGSPTETFVPAGFSGLSFADPPAGLRRLST